MTIEILKTKMSDDEMMEWLRNAPCGCTPTTACWPCIGLHLVTVQRKKVNQPMTHEEEMIQVHEYQKKHGPLSGWRSASDIASKIKGEKMYDCKTCYSLYKTQDEAINCCVVHSEVRGENIGFKGDKGKPRWSLLPLHTIAQVIQVLEFGANRYAVDNWQHVQDHRRRYYDATMRHIEAWWTGEKVDADSGLPHLAHATACLLFLMWFDERVE